jgi:hypothetical protein
MTNEMAQAVNANILQGEPKGSCPPTVDDEYTQRVPVHKYVYVWFESYPGNRSRYVVTGFPQLLYANVWIVF